MIRACGAAARAPEVTFLSKYARAFGSAPAGAAKEITKKIGRSSPLSRLSPSPGQSSSTVAASAARTSAGTEASGRLSLTPHFHPRAVGVPGEIARRGDGRRRARRVQACWSRTRTSPGAFGESGPDGRPATRAIRASPGDTASQGAT